MSTLGFTGTRRGMTPEQLAAVADLMLDYETLLHGDCVGADAQAHALAVDTWLRVEVYPPVDERFRAHCNGAALVHPPEPYLVRDRLIVNHCDLLAAAPYEMREVLRGSGTWATIRYARKVGRPVRIVSPGGVVTDG